MNGRKYSKGQQLISSVNRRTFLIHAGLLCSWVALNGCLRKFKPGAPSYSHIKGAMKGPNARAGHMLRDKLKIPPATSGRQVKTLIIGGGISGISAARYLKKNGYDNFEVLDLESAAGGNSRFAENPVSRYPLGGHYITIANNHDAELMEFLKECGVITHEEDGQPFYNEYYLCFDPEERLLINGQWQDGLVPEFGITEADRKQIKEFMQFAETLQSARGTDGKFAFDLPLDNSSADRQYRDLDQLSFKSYLTEKGFNSPYLLWYLDYCCKDDYGRHISDVSAWAGLHYFAARKGTAANAEANAVLTWPEGNGWLTNALAATVGNHIKTSQLAYRVTETTDGNFETLVYDLKADTTYTILSERVIMASPQFVNRKLSGGITRTAFNMHNFNYAPWLVANLTLSREPAAGAVGLGWDNVAYGTASVGYVNANQQHVEAANGKKVFTYYLPLCKQLPAVSRLAAYSRSYEQWMDMIVPELEFMHPGITELIEEAELWVWGHGMISPVPGFIWGQARINAKKPINNRVFFAHTDLSGISIFEEAFHQGIRAAKEVLQSYE